MIDEKLFDLKRLVETLLAPHGAGYNWRLRAEIIPDYMPPYPRPGTTPTVVIRYGEWFLRHSKGPLQGHTWDSYGDHYHTPELALLALMETPQPPPWSKPYLEFLLPRCVPSTLALACFDDGNNEQTAEQTADHEHD